MASKGVTDPEALLKKVLGLVDKEVDHIIANQKAKLDPDTCEVIVKFLSALPRAIKFIEERHDDDVKAWSQLSKKELKEKAMELLNDIDE